MCGCVCVCACVCVCQQTSDVHQLKTAETIETRTNTNPFRRHAQSNLSNLSKPLSQQHCDTKSKQIQTSHDSQHTGAKRNMAATGCHLSGQCLWSALASFSCPIKHTSLKRRLDKHTHTHTHARTHLLLLKPRWTGFRLQRVAQFLEGESTNSKAAASAP